MYKNIFNKTLVYLIVFFTLTTPYIRINNLPAVRLEHFVVLCFFIYIFYLLIKNKEIKLKWNKFVTLFILFSVWIIISILSGYLSNIKIITNDFFEIYKIIIYTSVFLITINAISNKNEQDKLIRFIIYVISFTALIAIVQYFNIFSLNEKYLNIYAPIHKITLVNNYPYPRSVGLSSNPNIYAVISAIGVILSYVLYHEKKEKIFLFTMVLNFFSQILTKSRSGMVLLVVAMVLFTIFYSKEEIFHIFTKKKLTKKQRQKIYTSIQVLIIFILIFFLLPIDFTWRYYDGLNISKVDSWNNRIETWDSAIEMEPWEDKVNWDDSKDIEFFSNPLNYLLGIGPAKSCFKNIHLDNEWLLLFIRYGIIGLLYLIFLFIYPIYRRSKYLHSINKVYLYAYGSILLGSALYMIPSAVFHSFELMPLYMVLAGISLQSEKKNIKVRDMLCKKEYV